MREKKVPENLHRLTLVRLREGYDVGDVDAFLVRVEPRLTGRPDPALADEIVTARFTPVRLRTGYDIGEVDELLDDLARRARTGA